MRLYVVAHKEFTMPPQLGPIYQPLQVGAALRTELGYQRDDTGDNISKKNESYNEMTGLYWIWKNSTEDIVGLCHYRRYFVRASAKIKNLATGRVTGFLQEQDIRKMLEKKDIIVHNKTFFRQGVRKQFESTQSAQNLAILENVVDASGAQYAAAFKKVMDGKTVHLLNMFVAKKSMADRYCAWLFSVLRQTENQILEQNPQADMQRAMGMLGERLLDVWIIANDVRVQECFTVNTERIDRTPW